MHISVAELRAQNSAASVTSVIENFARYLQLPWVLNENELHWSRESCVLFPISTKCCMCSLLNRTVHWAMGIFLVIFLGANVLWKENFALVIASSKLTVCDNLEKNPHNVVDNKSCEKKLIITQAIQSGQVWVVLIGQVHGYFLN